MRVAEICPTCAIYTNAVCVIYDGEYLTNIDAQPLDDLQTILGKINDNLVPLSGAVAPTSVPVYVGQLYVDTATPKLYYARGTSSSADWVML